MAENEKKDLQKVEKVKSDKPSFWSKIGAWFKSLKSECKKISWMGWKAVQSNTGIVLVCVIAFAIVIGVLDLAFRNAIGGLSGLVNLIRN